MAKIKGKDLSLTIDGVEVNVEATSIVLDREDADTEGITFAEYDGSTPSQWFFTISANANYTAAGFWRLLWDNAGAEVPFVFKPLGNETASVDSPHFTGTATIVAKPPVGGGVNEIWTFEARLDVDGEPALVTV